MDWDVRIDARIVLGRMGDPFWWRELACRPVVLHAAADHYRVPISNDNPLHRSAYSHRNDGSALLDSNHHTAATTRVVLDGGTSDAMRSTG